MPPDEGDDISKTLKMPNDGHLQAEAARHEK